jgi:hypothetical protein
MIEFFVIDRLGTPESIFLAQEPKPSLGVEGRERDGEKRGEGRGGIKAM